MSRSKCTRELYKAFLQATTLRYSGKALSEVSPEALSHDSVSRWLQSRHLQPSGIWEAAEALIPKEEPCLLLADDSVLDKQRSRKIECVQPQYSGNAHKVISGIGLVNLVWRGLVGGDYVPVDYRLYEKALDGKTKNDHFREMLRLAKQRGITPEAVVMDAWYSSLDNLKAIRELGWYFVTGLKKNRIVNRGEVLETLEISDEGRHVHLRGFGWVMVYRFVAKNGRTDYLATNRAECSRARIEGYFKARWSIEVFHRELKQTCGIEHCQARTSRAQRNHIFLAIAAWLDRYKRRFRAAVSFYEQQWDIIRKPISLAMQRILATP
jgi:hypothetical protein